MVKATATAVVMSDICAIKSRYGGAQKAVPARKGLSDDWGLPLPKESVVPVTRPIKMPTQTFFFVIFQI